MDDRPPRRPFWYCTTRELLTAVVLIAVAFAVLTRLAREQHWDTEDWFHYVVSGLLFAPIAFFLVVLQRGGKSGP